MNIAARMGHWSARHRKTAILGWIAFVIAAAVLGGMVGTKEITAAENNSGDSAKASRLYDEAGFTRSASESVLVQARDATGSDDDVRAAAEAVAAAVEGTGLAHGLRAPLESEDGRSLLVQFDLNGRPHDAAEHVQPVLDAVAAVQAQHPDLRVEEFGDASATKALDATLGKDFQRAELLAIPVTLGILLIAFGAVVAALVPLVLALTAFVAATGLLAFTSQVIHVDATANSVMLLIGLAVGVDYSLFYLKREREERARGASAEAALQAAATTSGRSVLISGITVVIALAGMFLTDQAVFMGVAQGTILVVAVAVLGSLTILPAVMAWLGDRIEKGRIPFVTRRSRPGESRLWSAILGRVLRRPLLGAVLAGGVLLALAAPVLGMKTAVPGASDIPKSLPIMQTYERIQAAFPGGPMPAYVMISAPDIDAPDVQQGLQKLTEAAAASDQMGEVVSRTLNEAKTVAVVAIPLHGSGNDAESNAALDTLRQRIVPTTVGAVPDVKAYVSGETAGSRDFTDQLRGRAPWVFAFVLGLAFVLLLVAFRSLVIAVVSIALNLLSVGAAYGVMVLIFQHHWFDSVLGFTATGMITAWVPLFLFVILFGLSMDYHVFILSRVRENYDRGLPTREAVRRGLISTAGVITSAAVIMIAVFSVFATLSQVSMKQIGMGLAVAVLLDATVIRAVLLPSVMTLLGERNWYLPRWLAWIPQVSLEAETPAASAEDQAPVTV